MVRLIPASLNQIRPVAQIQSQRQAQTPPRQAQMPTAERNYCVFDNSEVDFWVRGREHSLPFLNAVLKNTDDEVEVVKTLYILNKMLDEGVSGIDKMYPTFSRFNDTKSANIQTFLAGIYRKTQVPDAFGPLVKMLIQNSLRGNSNQPFDPNEEIGGAILSYLCSHRLLLSGDEGTQGSPRLEDWQVLRRQNNGKISPRPKGEEENQSHKRSFATR